MLIADYFFTKDDPIFRNLANSTTILIEDLVRFNVPASSKVMKLRVTSNFLSNIVPTSTDKLYLQSLGDKAYVASTQIQKMYNTGSFALDELFNEFQDIRRNLPQPCQNSSLTQKDAQYFCARLDQVLNLVTKFRDRFIDIERTIREIQTGYSGSVRGFSDVVKYFNENESRHRQIYDMERIQLELDFEQEQMVQLVAVDYEVIRVRQSLDLYKKNLVSFVKRILDLINKKIVTQEDDLVLQKVIERVNTAKVIWIRMDENNSRVLGLEAR